MTAAINAARAGLSCLVLEMGVSGGQMATTSTVENFPGFPNGIGGPELSQAMADQVKNLGGEIRSSQAEKVDLAGEIKRVVLGDGEVLEARAVIIACGASLANWAFRERNSFGGWASATVPPAMGSSLKIWKYAW